MPRIPTNVPTQRRTPKLRLHKATGQGFVEIEGRRRYLGRFDLPGTQEKYHRLIAEWAANGYRVPVAPDEVTVAELALRWDDHALAYYRRGDGSLTNTVSSFRAALADVLALYAKLPAARFGPAALKAVRQRMIDRGLARSHINHQIRRIRQVFRWAAQEQLVSPETAHSLTTLQALHRGRTPARETERVKPVPQADIDKTLEQVRSPVAAMIRLQLLTGMRPGEVVQMRAIDLDMSGRTWVYRPARHKTDHLGHTREILLGPRAQAIVREWLGCAAAPLFSPRAAVEEKIARASNARKTPLSCGTRPGSNRVREPRRSAGEAYTVASYRRAIERGCEAAGVTVWTPHRLRHTAATRFRAEFGIEVAQSILGHRLGSTITEVYAAEYGLRSSEALQRVG